jgi:FixJ family two-component response regulator
MPLFKPKEEQSLEYILCHVRRVKNKFTKEEYQQLHANTQGRQLMERDHSFYYGITAGQINKEISGNKYRRYP